jgi:uncharacterized protein (UPF0264 family)
MGLADGRDREIPRISGDTTMTRLLASVRTAAEARLALAAGADFIDAKEAASGALGALPEPVVREIVAVVAGRRPVSSTVGDLPMDVDRVIAAVERTAATGVDIVKVGFFPDARQHVVARAVGRACRATRLVAVLFADLRPDYSLLPVLREAGWHGVMLDTAIKNGRGLRTHLSDAQLGEFVSEARGLELLVGLAGSLSSTDIEAMVELHPDYLGFRGALCRGGARGGELDPTAIQRVRERMNASSAELVQQLV